MPIGYCSLAAIPTWSNPRPMTLKFKFAVSLLVNAAGRLGDALADPLYAAAMAERLDAEGDLPANRFATRLPTAIADVTDGAAAQAGKSGDAGALTREQQGWFDEMERLTAGARRSAKLAFPADATLLHAEFQVGVDTPKGLANELARAGIILASARKYAAELKKHGWVKADADDLETALGNLSGKDLAQGKALEDRTLLTADKVRAANALYALCLAAQNAARLQYPSTKPGTEAARRRFLLDEFPPRDRSNPHGGGSGGNGTTPVAGATTPTPGT